MVLAVACGAEGPREEPGPARAAAAPAALDLTLEDLDGLPVQPLAREGSAATVFLLVRTDCPISNRYAPEVRRLYESFAPRGVAFWLVYPGTDEPVEAIRRHLVEYGYPFPALRDVRHELVDLVRAQVTPEAEVFAAGGELVYSGRIDNWYVSFGRARAEPTERDLRQALEATLAGRAYGPRKTRAIGCAIPPL